MNKGASSSRFASLRRHKKHAIREFSTLACLILAILLAACSTPWAAQPTDTPIPTLQMPNVQELPALFDLEEQEHVEGTELLRALEPANALDASRAQGVVVALGFHLYLLSVSGDTAKRLYPTIPCDPFDGETSDLTRDGTWLICLRPRGNYVVQPSEDPAAPVPTPLAGDMESHPSWAPDGLTLAAAGSFADPSAGYTDHCGVGVYRLSPERTTVQQIALLWTPDFENMEGLGHNGCRLTQVMWSPDGRTLALRVDEASGQYYLLPMTQFSTALTPHNGVTIPVYTVTKRALTLLPGSYTFPIARWMPASDGLLLFNEGRTAIVRYLVTTGQITAVFRLPDKTEHMCDFASLADGKRIVFTYCRIQVVKYSIPSQRLYLYTP